jgi:hypothetical protein
MNERAPREQLRVVAPVMVTSEAAAALGSKAAVTDTRLEPVPMLMLVSARMFPMKWVSEPIVAEPPNLPLHVAGQTAVGNVPAGPQNLASTASKTSNSLIKNQTVLLIINMTVY